MERILFILYVADQSRATAFYSSALELTPSLDVPGMTEFQLSDSTVLGLMPFSGIQKLLGETVIDATKGAGIPRCELYVHMDDPTEAILRSVRAGATLVSPLLQREWGDKVAYLKDPDGHIIAFASPRAPD